MSQLSSGCNLEKCSFSLEKDKLGTARDFGYNELKIPKTYTFECSFKGSAHEDG